VYEGTLKIRLVILDLDDSLGWKSIAKLFVGETKRQQRGLLHDPFL
jgi:hypothetical protein